MPRIRTIKPEFWQNEQLASLSEHARLLAIALLNHADDEGYFLANVALVRSACFPFEDDSTNVRRSIGELSSIGYIAIREAHGKTIGHVVKFREHQRIDRPQKSKLAEQFEQFSAVNTAKESFDEHSTNDRRIVDDGSLLERKGTGKGKENSCAEVGKQPTAPAFDPNACRFPVFPCSGDPKMWQATEQQLADWSETYPAVDIQAAHRKAHAWIMANITKRKTAAGYAKYLNTWFAKDQDSGKSQKQAEPAVPHMAAALTADEIAEYSRTGDAERFLR
jgi:hypothetical protein